MTKRQFETMAGILRDVRRVVAEQTERAEKHGIVTEPGAYAEMVLEGIARRMADVFEGDNPRFDRERFLLASRGQDAETVSGRKVRYSKVRPGGINEVAGGPAIGAGY